MKGTTKSKKTTIGKILPHVGLGLSHHLDRATGEVNPEGRKWAKKQLKRLWDKGHRRAVIERDAPIDEPRFNFFDEIADAAKKMGFEVRRESKYGFSTQLKAADATALAWFDRFPGEPLDDNMKETIFRRDAIAAMNSNRMARLAFREPSTVLVAGFSHIIDAEDIIAPHLKEPFEAKYSPRMTPEHRIGSYRHWFAYHVSLPKKARIPLPEKVIKSLRTIGINPD